MSEFIKAWQAPNYRTVYEDKEGNLTVREGGYANWRNNNPGNVRYNDETVGLGAIGSMKSYTNTVKYPTGRTPKIKTNGKNAKPI